MRPVSTVLKTGSGRPWEWPRNDMLEAVRGDGRRDGPEAISVLETALEAALKTARLDGLRGGLEAARSMAEKTVLKTALHGPLHRLPDDVWPPRRP
mmetsp:Transcript_6855/g.24197  ORF Transcript_6855/g.24197 Transcript_6855/m.24197 type:complete len:96 (-) Transcript_6855:130-417(-)